jgi:hypothetical protein
MMNVRKILDTTHDPRPALAALPDRIGDLVAPITGMEEAAE